MGSGDGALGVCGLDGCIAPMASAKATFARGVASGDHGPVALVSRWGRPICGAAVVAVSSSVSSQPSAPRGLTETPGGTRDTQRARFDLPVEVWGLVEHAPSERHAPSHPKSHRPPRLTGGAVERNEGLCRDS